MFSFLKKNNNVKKSIMFMDIYRSVVSTIGRPEDVDYGQILFKILQSESSADVFIQIVLAIGFTSSPGLLIMNKFLDPKYKGTDILKQLTRRELFHLHRMSEKSFELLDGAKNEQQFTKEPFSLFDGFRKRTFDLMQPEEREIPLEKRLIPSLSRVQTEIL